MIYLIASILCSASLFIMFKWFGQNRIDTFQAIVINYAVAFGCGALLDPIPLGQVFGGSNPWLPWALGLGVLFIALFYLIAITAQRISVSVATVSTKMSIVIPIIAAVPLYGDTMPALKVVGILLALAGVVLASWTGEKLQFSSLALILPIILFAGNGTIDLVLKYVQHEHLGEESPIQFSSMIFGTAGLIGIVVLTGRNLLQKKSIDLRSILAGIALGLPNFGSIYFLMKALALSGMQSSEIFPINNMGVVLLSALGAMLFFGEKGSRLNRLGVALSIIAIALIAFHGSLFG